MTPLITRFLYTQTLYPPHLPNHPQIARLPDYHRRAPWLALILHLHPRHTGADSPWGLVQKMIERDQAVEAHERCVVVCAVGVGRVVHVIPGEGSVGRLGLARVRRHRGVGDEEPWRG
jgi:hypothetical protein